MIPPLRRPIDTSRNRRNQKVFHVQGLWIGVIVSILPCLLAVVNEYDDHPLPRISAIRIMGKLENIRLCSALRDQNFHARPALAGSPGAEYLIIQRELREGGTDGTYIDFFRMGIIPLAASRSRGPPPRSEK